MFATKVNTIYTTIVVKGNMPCYLLNLEIRDYPIAL